MPTIDDVKNAVKAGWRDSRAAQLSIVLASNIERLDLTNAKHLSIERLLELSGSKELEADFLAALNILSACNPPLLQLEAYLSDANGEIELDAEDIELLITENEVVHPITGDLIERADEVVVIYYQVAKHLTDSALK